MITIRPQPTSLVSTMIRILLATLAAVGTLSLAACCCTGEPKAPKLRKLPKFQEMPAAPEVVYEK